MFLGNAARAQRGAEEDVEEEGGILLSLLGEMVPALDDHQLATQLLHIWRGGGEGR